VKLTLEINSSKQFKAPIVTNPINHISPHKLHLTKQLTKAGRKNKEGRANKEGGPDFKPKE
jgi:hypothetical protein